MTIDEIKAKAEMLLKNSRETQGEFVQVYNNGFEDGVKFVLQNFCKPDVSGCKELLERMLKREREATTAAKWVNPEYNKRLTNVLDIAAVLELLNNEPHAL